MNFIEVCTRRPVAITMVTLAVMLFGAVSLSRLGVTLLPDLSYPTLTVRTELPGAAPTEIETLLSRPVEEAVGTIKNVRQVRSVSRAGQSDVTLEFNWGTAMDFAVLDVREKLDALQLAREAARPIVLRFDPSQDPIVRLGLSLRDRADGPAAGEPALKRLRRIAEDQIQKSLEGVEGVAAVKISGGLEDEIQVLVDLPKLSQLNLTLETVAQRLAAENANVSGGRVDEGTLSYLVRTLNQFQDLDEIRNTIVSSGGRPAGVPGEAAPPVYVKDLAEVRAGYKERDAIIRIDGDEAVEVALYKEGDANTVTVAEGVLARAGALRAALPPEFELTTLYDQSVFITQAIDEVMQAALEGGILAILVLYLFLRSAWTTAIVSVAIPVSVIATFNVMYGTGLSLNIMSLGGIALAIGMLVDDAIVVLENIARKMEQGLAPAQAAAAGAGEVAGAVTASTLTTVAVFFPMVFVEGIAGQLFADQALVVSGALMFSLLVSLSVIPMMVSRRGDPVPVRPAAPAVTSGAPWRLRLSRFRVTALEHAPARALRPLLAAAAGVAWLGTRLLRPAAGRFLALYAGIEARYARLLRWSLAHRAPVLFGAAALFAFSLLLLTRIGVELIPPFAQGELRAEVTLPPGTPLEKSDALLRELSRAFAGDGRLGANYSVAGSGNRLDVNAESSGENVGVLNLSLARDALHREPELIGDVTRRLDAIPGAEYRFTRPTLFTLKTPLEIEFAGYDLEALARASEALRTSLAADPGFTEVASTLSPGHPEVQVVFDQERAAALGLNTADLAARLARAVQGNRATRFRIADREIDVVVRGSEDLRTSVDAVRRLAVNPDRERPLTLDAVADVRVRTGPSEIRRIDQQRVVVVSAGVAGADLGEAVADVRRRLGDQALPAGISAGVAGQSEEMEVSFRSLQLALALAVFLVYLVMASQFESLLHPFVILFTIPLAGIGAILFLYGTGSVINVVALIGMIVLAGIVVKNGIVLIDLVNRLRAEGLPRHEAILKAGPARLRPILMTTLTTVLGLLPMALGAGEGAEVRQPMAITVIGGLLVSTLLTLVVIPVVYTLLDRQPDPAPDVAFQK